MSKLIRMIAAIALVAGALSMTPQPARAYYWHGGGGWHGGGWHGGGWHGGGWYGRGGWGWGPGFGVGIGLGYTTWGYPYYYGPRYYAPPVYYAPRPACGWARVRVWHGYWVVRRVWRCW